VVVDEQGNEDESKPLLWTERTSLLTKSLTEPTLLEMSEKTVYRAQSCWKDDVVAQSYQAVDFNHAVRSCFLRSSCRRRLIPKAFALYCRLPRLA
jgi:hypothetical protein